MKDYYNAFVQLSMQQCTKNDYEDKKKVKQHNAALKKLQHLQFKMKEFDCTEILNMLLFHEDDRVKMNAASLCLQIGVLTDRAEMILKNIIETSEDSTICFSAKMILKSSS